MNEEQHTHELIDQYLQGQMIGEDMDLFRIRMKEDKAFLHQVQLQKALIQHLEKQREAELKALFKTKSKKRGAFIIPLNRRILSVAAVLLAITALAMVLKMYLPITQTAEDLTITEEPTLDSNELNKALDEGVVQIPIDSGKSSVQNNTPTIELAEETIEEDEEPSLNRTLSESEAVEDLSELKTEESMLDAKNIKPQKDVLLSSKRHITLIYSANVKNKTATRAESLDATNTAATETTSKKDKSMADDASEKFAGTNAVDTIGLLSSTGKTITVEYWKSIVNFKGYHYDGKVLMLYEVSPESKIQVLNYDGKTYMKWGGAVYRLLNNDKYEPFYRVRDASILNAINK